MCGAFLIVARKTAPGFGFWAAASKTAQRNVCGAARLRQAFLPYLCKNRAVFQQFSL